MQYLAAAWAFIRQFLIPLLQFGTKVMENWAAYQSNKAGREQKEAEIKRNEKRVGDTLRSIDPSELSDDEAFKPRQP